MANASGWAFTAGAASTVVAPAAGQLVMGYDSSNHLWTKDTNSNLWIPALTSAIVAASAAINTAETVINNVLAIPVGLLQAGTTIRFRIQGTCTSTAGNASTFTFRAGTLGTTGDSSVATWAITAQTSGTAIPFDIEILYSVRTTGAPGTGNGFMRTNNQGTTGIFTAVADVRSTASNTGPNTSTATKLSLTYQAAATTTTCTFQVVTTEVMAI